MIMNTTSCFAGGLVVIQFVLYLQATTFGQVIDGDISESEEKSITALGLLNTMETILTVMEDQKEVYCTFKKVSIVLFFGYTQISAFYKS